MPTLNVEIDIQAAITKCQKTEDSEKVSMSEQDLLHFVADGFGEPYLTLMIPNDGIFSELHAEKKNMKKKGAVFELTHDRKTIKVNVKGVFKVKVYAHVAERIKEASDNIIISGIYAGDWPPVGGQFDGVDLDGGKWPFTAKLC